MDNPTPKCTSHGASYSALTFSFLAGGTTGAAVSELKDRATRRGQEIREEATYRVEGAASALAGKAGKKERGKGDPKDDD
jgi:hypothetical protein